MVHLLRGPLARMVAVLKVEFVLAPKLLAQLWFQHNVNNPA